MVWCVCFCLLVRACVRRCMCMCVWMVCVRLCVGLVVCRCGCVRVAVCVWGGGELGRAPPITQPASFSEIL